ncbi:hypothetical protein GOP47_0007460 [Adiantum capillus-veneris]|uniref:RING-type domain-containing protein n=1 Tax=Adiantum capillus-veneris TaxID=13818 RepID=A0A9D4ZLJ4_ADICA|nr:hypothetical protein GOP47_0007460 [Adiantum capillus-veneris]
MGTSINNSSTPAIAANATPTSPMSATVNLVMTTFGFLISAIFIIFVLVRLLCARFCRHRHASGQGELNQGGGRGASGMDPLMITLFPTIMFSGDVFASQEDAMCAVCLGEYEDHDFLRILPHCGHTFHVGCIDAWLRRNSTCPVCRVFIQNTPSRRRSSSQLLSEAARSRFSPGVIPECLFEQPLSTLSSSILDARAAPAHFALHVRHSHGDHVNGDVHTHVNQIEPTEDSRIAVRDSVSCYQLQGRLDVYETIAFFGNVPFASADQERASASTSTTVQAQEQDFLCKLPEDILFARTLYNEMGILQLSMQSQEMEEAVFETFGLDRDGQEMVFL